ncbi:hypothetical protein VdG1_05624 [Verticillium dahliae VDG1]|nr:hypothetical protein VdG1_05624 [Verticillium dahliae VDG1]
MAEPTTFPLPPILQHADPTPTLITQGAEGRLYKTTYLVPSRPAALKYRPSKPYRHPILDARLTRTRILAEARVLHKCRRDGVLEEEEQQQQEAVKLQTEDGRPSAEAERRLREDRDLKALMRKVGAAVGRLHNALEGDVVLIDFGLAYQNSMDEDRAVDLYVLERAYGSTHPRAESLFPELLEGYKEALPAKQSTLVLRKLEDVRMRGRKRSMVG